MEGYIHETDYGTIFCDPRGDHWIAYYAHNIGHDNVVIDYTTGTTAVDAIVNLIDQAMKDEQL